MKEEPDRQADLELARKCAAGDLAAQEELFRVYHPMIFSVCMRMLRDPESAEDLAQDSIIQILRKIETFQGDAKLRTWIYRLTVNQVLMHMRRQSRYYVDSVSEFEDFKAQPVPGTENHLRMSINHRILLEDCIGRLPNGYRSVFVLHDVHGYEHEEVARLLGCSVGTSKSQLHKARLKLQQLIRRQNPLFAAA